MCVCKHRLITLRSVRLLIYAASYILLFLYTPSIIFHSICVWSRSLVLYRSRSCGETSTILADTLSSVSSVGVQSKGSFIVLLVTS